MHAISGIEKIFDDLLSNVSEIQEAFDNPIFLSSAFDQQSKLLDALFKQWDQLSEEDKCRLLSSKLESKVQQLSKRNRSCLKEVQQGCKKSSKRAEPASAFQVNLEL